MIEVNDTGQKVSVLMCNYQIEENQNDTFNEDKGPYPDTKTRMIRNNI